MMLFTEDPRECLPQGITPRCPNCGEWSSSSSTWDTGEIIGWDGVVRETVVVFGEAFEVERQVDVHRIIVTHTCKDCSYAWWYYDHDGIPF